MQHIQQHLACNHAAWCCCCFCQKQNEWPSAAAWLACTEDMAGQQKVVTSVTSEALFHPHFLTLSLRQISVSLLQPHLKIRAASSLKLQQSVSSHTFIFIFFLLAPSPVFSVLFTGTRLACEVITLILHFHGRLPSMLKKLSRQKKMWIQY